MKHSFAEGIIPEFPGTRGLVFTAASTKPHEAKVVRDALLSWRHAARSSASPVTRDAVELAGLAYGKWSSYRKDLETAATLRELQEQIQNNPYAEVAVLLLARSPEPTSRRLRMRIGGVCLFRRTWCNNLFIDYLAKHPHASMKGIGVSLLWYVARIASTIKADAIWAETTQNSVGYYKKVFGKPEMTDLLYLRRDEYEAFWKQVEGLPPGPGGANV